MRVFKRQISACKILLCASILVNVVLLTFCYKVENYGHYFRHIGEKYGIIPYNVQNRPDFWSVRGWNTTIKKLDYQCDVMFFGHSQIEMSDFRKYFPNKRIITSGYPGDNVEGMRMRVEQIEALKPSKIFLMCGVNSLRMSDNEFITQYDLLVNEIKNASPDSELYIFNILPECDGSKGKLSNNKKIVERNSFIKEYTQENNIALIDLYSLYADENGALLRDATIDGIHLKPHGYDRWAAVIKPYIDK